MDKLFLLKVLMRVLAVLMGVGLGLSHLLFPGDYFDILGQIFFDQSNPFQLFLANMIGVLVIALCVGLWLAANDPVRHRPVVIQFIVGGAITVPVYCYHLVTGALRGWEWVMMLLVLAATFAVWSLFPWNQRD